ncbi:MAG: energy transducer TonB [Rhodoferax sp.]|nr:energy transducer TonB [Rhodoferax sp.]
MNRNALIVGSVDFFPAALLWAVQSGLMRSAIDVIVPAEILVEFIEPAAPKVIPPRPTPPKPAVAKQAVTRATPTQIKSVEPLPLAIADPMPSPNAPVGAAAPAVVVAPQAAAPAVAAPPAPARVELPSSDADYLQNPRPAYPGLSKRLGEQGKVLVRVFIEVDGKAQKAEIKQSSGFERLDQAALATVLRWRYVPGKRAGVAESMWFNVPINFVLE